MLFRALQRSAIAVLRTFPGVPCLLQAYKCPRVMTLIQRQDQHALNPIDDQA